MRATTMWGPRRMESVFQDIISANTGDGRALRPPLIYAFFAIRLIAPLIRLVPFGPADKQ